MSQQRGTALVVREAAALAQEDLFSDARVQLIKNTVARNVPDDVFLAMMDLARRRNLDPLAKQISAIQFGGQYQMIVTIDGYRSIAEQTGQYAGQDEPKFTYEDEIRTQAGKRAPTSATVTVYKMVDHQRCPFTATVYWEEYAGRNNWNTMPRTMLAKCFDPDTEVLTDRGFQRFDAVTGRVMQVTERGLEATDAVPFAQPWTGEMVSLDSDDLNFSVTPNHDMLTTDGKVEAGEMYERSRTRPVFRIPRIVRGTRPDAPLTDQQIALAAAYLADGYDRSGGTFAISVSREAKVALLRKIGGEIAEVAQPDAGRQAQTATRVITTRRDKVRFSYPFRLVEPLCERGKRVRTDALLSLSQRQARIFVDTWMACDGHGRFLYTSRPDHLEAFEVAAVVAGYSAGQRRSRSSDIGRSLNYAIPVSHRDAIPVVRWGREYKDKGGNQRHRTGLELTRNTAGVVWCVTVPSGVIVVRRHGFSMLCGNCAESHALRKAFPSVMSGTYTREEMDQAERLDPETGEIEEPTNTDPALDPEFMTAMYTAAHGEPQEAQYRPVQEGPSPRQNKLIHALKRDLRISDNELHQIAYEYIGVTSLTELNKAKASALIDELKRRVEETALQPKQQERPTDNPAALADMARQTQLTPARQHALTRFRKALDFALIPQEHEGWWIQDKLNAPVQAEQVMASTLNAWADEIEKDPRAANDWYEITKSQKDGLMPSEEELGR